MANLSARAAAFMALVMVPAGATAASLEDLAREGYGVVVEARVDGEFEGCEYGRQIPLSNGLTFQCTSYVYRYAYGAEVLILQHVTDGDIKVLIDGEQMDGNLFQ